VERIVGTTVDTLPYSSWVPERTIRLPNLDHGATVTSPRLGGGSINGQAIWGQEEDFFEWSAAKVWIVDGGIQRRPTDKAPGGRHLRGAVVPAEVRRVHRQHQPQSTGQAGVSGHRSVFLRAAGEYRHCRQDDLRDDSCSGNLGAREGGTNQGRSK